MTSNWSDLASLRDAIARVSPDELLQAHNDAQFIGRISTAATAVGRMLFPGSDVVGFGPIAAAAEGEAGMFVVMMVLLRRQLGTVIDEWRREMTPALAQLEAQAAVARDIPAHLVSYMAPVIGAARLAALPDQEREAQTGYDTPP